jgi:type I restriction enzyme S subunit
MEMIQPKLRFSEYKEKYKNSRVDDFAPLQRGFDLPITKMIKGKFPVVFSNGISKTHNEFKVKAPGIVTGRSGTIGNLFFIEEDFWPHNTSLWVTDFKGNYPKYVYYFYSKFDLKRFETGSGVPTLNRNDVHNQNIYYPSFKEQTKIANFLSEIDEKTNLLKENKSLLEEYKKGIMQKIFNRDLKFKDDNGYDFEDWVEKSLGEIGNTFNGLTGKTKKDFGTGKPYIQYKQIFDNSTININGCQLVDIKEKDNQNKVQFGDVFFTISSETQNEIGTASVLLDNVKEMFLNSFCFGYRANSLSELVPEFSRYLFRNELFRNDIIKLAQGSTRYNMSKVSLMKLIVSLPQTNEQIKIANFLSSIDEKIELVNTQIQDTQEYKKGLLQQMFV